MRLAAVHPETDIESRARPVLTGLDGLDEPPPLTSGRAADREARASGGCFEVASSRSRRLMAPAAEVPESQA